MATAPNIAAPLTFRTFDAGAVNAVCNHSQVNPTLSLGTGDIDVSVLIADDRNLFFLGDFGGAMFHRTGPGVYAAHDFFLPGGRGQWALRASREMLARVFAEFRARLVWAETPVENRACRLFNRWLGFASEGVSFVRLLPDAPAAEVETFVMEAR